MAARKKTYRKKPLKKKATSKKRKKGVKNFWTRWCAM